MIRRPVALVRSTVATATVSSLAVAVALGLAGPAAAGDPEVLVLEPVADTTIFDVGDTSNGAGNRLFAGVTGAAGGFTRQRSPMLFDLSAIPADATVLDATLQVTLVQSNPVTQEDDPYELRRLLAAWGEAGSFSNGGQGAPAQTDDATWNFAFFPGTAWGTPGGDLAADQSAFLLVGRTANSTWTFSDPRLVADVAGWLADPATNHGWALMSADEDIIWTARKFGSREASPDARPMLTITYEAGGGCGGDLDGSGQVDFGDVLAVLAAFGPCDGCPEDLNESGNVGFDDLLLLLAAFGDCIAG